MTGHQFKGFEGAHAELADAYMTASIPELPYQYQVRKFELFRSGTLGRCVYIRLDDEPNDSIDRAKCTPTDLVAGEEGNWALAAVVLDAEFLGQHQANNGELCEHKGAELVGIRARLSRVYLCLNAVRQWQDFPERPSLPLEASIVAPAGGRVGVSGRAGVVRLASPWEKLVRSIIFKKLALLTFRPPLDQSGEI